MQALMKQCAAPVTAAPDLRKPDITTPDTRSVPNSAVLRDRTTESVVTTHPNGVPGSAVLRDRTTESVVTTHPEGVPNSVRLRSDTEEGKLSTAAVATLRERTTESVVTTPATSVVTTPGPMISTPCSEAARMPESVRRTAEERLLFLEKVEEIKREMPGLTDPLAAIQAAIRWESSFPILRTSGQRGASQLTYQNYRNWKRRIKDVPEGERLAALADQYKRGWTDPRADRYATFYTEFNRIWLHGNRVKVSDVYRKTRDTVQRVWPTAAIPSLSAARYYIRHVPREVVIYEREGEVAWRNKCCDYAERDWRMIEPGYLAVGDSRPFDTWVRVRTEDGGWGPRRPVLSALMDAKSWYMVSWMITLDSVKTDDQIKLLAQYCCATGGYPPCEAYFDNGKDYVAKGYSTPMELCGQEYSIFAALGIRLTRANPYNGRAKTIESNFKNVMQRFDKMFPAYLGSNPLERPDAADYHEKHPEELPDLGTFCRIFADWLGAYQRDGKEGTIHEGRSPEELWAARTMRSRRRSMDELREAFMRPYGVREIGRGGRISVEGRYYFTDNVRWGEKVIVKTDPFHADRIGVYDLTGARIGDGYLREAVAALVHGDEYERAKLEDRMARQRAQEREVKRLALELKGGRQSASPIEEMLTAGTDVRMVKRGEIRTVKGKNHVFKRLAPAKDVFASDEDKSPTDEVATLRDSASTVEQCPAPLGHGESEEETAQTVYASEKPDLTNIYNYVHSKPNNQGENYDEW